VDAANAAGMTAFGFARVTPAALLARAGRARLRAVAGQ